MRNFVNQVLPLPVRFTTADSLAPNDPAHDVSLLYAQIKMNEARLQLAAEASGAGLWSLELDTHLFWFNDTARDIFHLPKIGEISFEEFLNRAHPDDHQLIREGMDKAIRDNQTPAIEYRILLPDGSVRWVVSRGAVYTFAGNRSYFLGATADITEKKEKAIAIERQLSFEALLSDISTTFAKLILPSDVDEQIEHSLMKILDYFGGDRIGLLELDLENNRATITHSHYREGVKQAPPVANLAELFPWSFNKVRQGHCYCFSDIAEVPSEAHVDRQTWMETGVKSVLHVPLSVERSNAYIIEVSSLTTNIAWPREMLPRLQLIGELFLGAIYRKKAKEDLRTSYNEIAKLKEKLQVEADYLRAEVRASQFHEEIVGQSETITRVLAMVEQVAPTSSTVLIYGETGTGKELIAQAIHNHSPRRDKLMVKVNCASLPSSLVESELFGRERGAYTGALTRQIGRFELADGSSLFLDEISELSLELQAKLLRVLQEGEFERLGSPKTIKVNVRVIAATNRNLLQEVKNGRFREDLYYRLNVFPILVPPLRERLEDVPVLVWEFIREFNKKMGKRIHKISKKDMASLQEYSWPGNIRELRNVIEHAAIISPGDELKIRLPQTTTNGTSPRMTLEEVEIQHIRDILKQTRWRIKGDGGAAEILGMNPATLYSRMKKYGISSQP